MLPTTFWLVLTYRCNDRCQGCYAAASCSPSVLPSGPRQMSPAYARQVMTELRRRGAAECLLIGGEPTLYDGLAETIHFGSSLGLRMKLVSNGRRLSDARYLATLRGAGLDHVSISLEAASAPLHDAITASSGFAERIRAIKNVVRLGIPHNTILTISPLNVTDIVPVAELVHGLGVRNILYNFCMPSPTGTGGINGSATLDPRLCANAIAAAYRALTTRGIPLRFFATIPLCLIPDATARAMANDRTLSSGYHCHMFFGTGVAFEPDGSVLPCTHFAGTPLFNAMREDGSFDGDRFATEWETGSHATFVRATWQYPAERCKTCSSWGACVGGCPLLWMHFDPADYLAGTREATNHTTDVTEAIPG